MSFNPFAKIALNSLFISSSQKDKKSEKKAKRHKKNKRGSAKTNSLVEK